MVAEKTVLNIGLKDGSVARITIEGDDRSPLYGLKIGEEFKGDLIDTKYKDYVLMVTGGSDDDGVPMRSDLDGTARQRLLLSGGVGYNPKREGVRKRKLVRGNEIFDDIAQINIKVVTEGKTPLTE